MALQIDYTKIRREIGREIGIGTDTTDTNAWTADVVQSIADAIDAGMNRWYWPMIPAPTADGAPQRFNRYIWSFLSPQATLAVTASTGDYDLPADFTDMASDGFSFSAGVEQPRIVRITGEQIDVLRAQAPQSGPPKYYAITAKPAVQGAATRYEVGFYPTPDASYTLIYSYSIVPDSLSDANPYPLGAAQHSQTILHACLAEADRIFEINNGGANEIRFRELLTASIEYDKSLQAMAAEAVWPLKHPSSDLGVNKAYLRRLVGNLMEFGPNAALWSATQTEQVKMVVETGLRNFYSAPTAQGESRPWNWSFLRPTKRMDFTTDKWRYDLPADFAMLTGPILFEPGTGEIYPPIVEVSERQVMRKLQVSTSAGRPEIAAYRAKDSVAGEGTRYELILWPPPDDDYEVNVRYQVNPGMLDDETSLPFGGQENMQTVIEACLAAAEQSKGQPGVHMQLYERALQASVKRDQDKSAPDTMGRLRDTEDRYSHDFSDLRYCDRGIVTYNGVEY